MTFIDAWLVWLLAMSQPNAPTQVGVQAHRPTVNAVYPTTRATTRSNAVFSTSSVVVAGAPIQDRSDLRTATQISNGY